MTINIFCRGCQCSFLSSIAEVAGSEINFPIFLDIQKLAILNVRKHSQKMENAKNVYVLLFTISIGSKNK